MSPKEAIDEYVKALTAVGADLKKYQFRVENGRICLGHMYGPGIDDVQWGMMWYTPEEFFRVAKMRRLDFPPVKRVGRRFVEVDRETL